MKNLLSLVCVLTLLLALVPSLAAPVSAETRQTLYHEILERDGFIEGVWFPWFTHDNLGCGLTTNEVAAKYITNAWYDFKKVGIDSYGADKIYAEIFNLKALGFNMLALAGSAYGEGVLYDNNGDVVGIKQEYLDNTRRFLDICREVGMPVMWNIYFHCSSVPDYYGMDAWNMMCRMLGDPTVADHYAERFVKPLCKVLGEYDDVVALIALTDEVENETEDPDLPGDASAFGTTKENLHYFVNAMNTAVKKTVPQIARTIAANSDDLGLYSDVEVDVLGRNRYSDEGTVPDVPAMYPTAPTLLTEYNLHSAAGMSETEYSKIQIKFRDEMKKAGYQGGFLWCWQPNVKGGAMDLLRYGATTTSDFRQSMYDRYYYTIDATAAHRGKTVTLDAISLFYYKGGGLLEWIPSRQATTVTIEKSINGGKNWQRVTTVSQSSLLKNGKCVYQAANTLPTDVFRVTVTDGKGHTASAVTNDPGVALEYVREKKTVSVTPFRRPTVVKASASFASTSSLSLTSFGVKQNRPNATVANLITNSSFEYEGGGPWNHSAFLSPSVKVVEDPTAPDGSHSLYFDTSASSAPQWYTFTVHVEKHTEYTLSAWVKGAYISDDNRFYGSLGVLNPATKTFATYSPFNGKRSRPDQQIYPPAWDNTWHLRSVTFNSGNHAQVVIGLYGAETQMWVDDIALYKENTGMEYRSDVAKGLVTLSHNYEYLRCDPAKSVTENLRFDDSKSTYWQSGGGWDAGFLRIADAPNGYGKALKYTASPHPAGVSYIKWIPVKKDTRYVVTFDYKVVKEGAGRIGLAVRKGDGIRSVVFVEMNSTANYEDKNGWCTFSTMLNTDNFDELALYITDLGGEGYIDNLRVFLPEDGSNVSDVGGGNSGTTAPVVRPTTTQSTTAVTVPTESGSAAPTTMTTVPTDGTVPTEGTTLPTGADKPTTTQPAAVPDAPTDTDAAPDGARPVWVWVGVGAAALTVIGGITALFLLLRRRKHTP